MAKPNISMEFNYEQIQTRVSQAVADGIDKLRECNIDGENILEIYIDSKEIDKKKNKNEGARRGNRNHDRRNAKRHTNEKNNSSNTD